MQSKKASDFDRFDFMSDKKTVFSKDNKAQQYDNLCSIEVTTLTGDIPTPRNDHRNIIKDKKVYLVGGTTDKASPFAAFVLDLETNIWKETKYFDKSDQKKPVSGMGITRWPEDKYSHLKGFALMYGGWTGKQYSDNLFMINLQTMQIKTLSKEHNFSPNQIRQFKSKQAVSIGNSKEIEKYQTSQYPPPKKDLTLCYIPSENKICLYGGWQGNFNTGSKQELWILSSNWKWQKYYGVNRRGHTSVVIDDNKRGNGFLVFGGFKGIKVVSNQSLFFDLKNKKWHKLEFKEDELLPPGRAYHTSNLIGNKIIVVGGMDDQYKILEDIWVFDIDKRSWCRIALPIKQRHLTRRAGHSSFVIQDKLFLLGGMTSSVDKKQYVRIPLNQMVTLDFSRIAETFASKRIPHNVEHHWDVSQFGFSMPKKQQLDDLYLQLQSVGIMDNEM